MERYCDCVNGEFRKFTPDGAPVLFPGNTFLCHIPKGSFWRYARYAQCQTEPLSFAHKFALLPPSSFHMTVGEGVCDLVRRKDNWISSLPLDASLSEATTYLFSQLDKLPKSDGLRVRVKEFRLHGGIQVHVEPADQESAQYLNDFRSCLFDCIGMNNLNAPQYQFHISLSYLLIELTEKEKKELDQVTTRINNELFCRDSIISLDAVEFCYFNDMFYFATLAKLKK